MAVYRDIDTSIRVNGNITASSGFVINGDGSGITNLSSAAMLDVFKLDGSRTVTGTIVVSSGQISLTNGTKNKISMGSAGISSPNFTGTSDGTKIVLLSNSGEASGFGIGESYPGMKALWSQSFNMFEWYSQNGVISGNPVSVASLNGYGDFTATGRVGAKEAMIGGGSTGAIRLLTSSGGAHIQTMGASPLWLSGFDGAATVVKTPNTTLDDGTGRAVFKSYSVQGSALDLVNDAPLYGFGMSNIVQESAPGASFQIGGFSGVHIKTAGNELRIGPYGTPNAFIFNGNVIYHAGNLSPVTTTRTITAGTGLTGGGDLSANRTISVVFGSGGTQVASGNHLHDDRYYTESEVDSKLRQVVEYAHGQHTLMGGGTITWVSTNHLKWNVRFIAIPVGKAQTNEGFVNMEPPAIGTDIPIFGTGLISTVTASGVPMGDWYALYAIHAPGGSYDSISYVLVDYNSMTSANIITPNMILLAARNNENNTIRLGTGQILGYGDTITNGRYGISSIIGLQTALDAKMGNGSGQSVSGNFSIGGDGNLWVGTAAADSQDGDIIIRDGAGQGRIRLSGDVEAPSAGTLVYIDGQGNAQFSGNVAVNNFSIVSSGNIANLNASYLSGRTERELAKNESILELGGKGTYDGCSISAQLVPNMTVRIAAGTAYTNTGRRVRFTGAESISIAPASSTYGRVDAVYIRGSSEGANEGTLNVATGTPAPTPVAPSIPADGIRLANISVPQNIGSIQAAHITDTRLGRPVQLHPNGNDLLVRNSLITNNILSYGAGFVFIDHPTRGSFAKTLTIPAGQTSVTWSHGFTANGTNYAVTTSTNSPNRHVYWTNKASGSIVFNIDQATNVDITIDAIFAYT